MPGKPEWKSRFKRNSPKPELIFRTCLTTSLKNEGGNISCAAYTSLSGSSHP
jgi:hypothetical protein